MNKETNIAPLENPNNRIWEKICETDPTRTKKITGKKYRGDSINPNYIYEKLTGCFGPCGIGWGFDLVNEEWKTGKNGDIVHFVQIGLWYKNDGIKSEPIPGFGGTTFSGDYSSGPYSDDDAQKKSITDALTKASQLIGMSADIFGGMWDDCKYVAELKKKYQPKEEEPETPEETPPPAQQSKPTPETKENKSQTPAAPAPGGKKVTKAQAGLLWHKFTEAGFSADDIEAYCQYHYQVDSQYSVPMAAVKVILALFDNGELKTVSKAQAEQDIPF